MRRTLAFLGLIILSPAGQAATCTIEDHPTCTISCTAGCIASWVEPAGCATRCSEAEGVKTIKMTIQDASSKEIGNFMKSREFLKLFRQK
jgi:predicted outer membrane protein